MLLTLFSTLWDPQQHVTCLHPQLFWRLYQCLGRREACLHFWWLTCASKLPPHFGVRRRRAMPRSPAWQTLIWSPVPGAVREPCPSPEHPAHPRGAPRVPVPGAVWEPPLDVPWINRRREPCTHSGPAGRVCAPRGCGRGARAAGAAGAAANTAGAVLGAHRTLQLAKYHL